jgi:hypothetical protein
MKYTRRSITLEKKFKEVDLTISKLGAELKVLREAEESLAGFTSGSKEFVQARVETRYRHVLLCCLIT